MPKLEETAQVICGSLVFQDWESVYVQHRWQQAWPIFRFTSTEKDLPLYKDYYRDMKFKPGDPCEIMLGNQLAVTGMITNRQVAYTATEHGVQLSGVGAQWAPATSSVPMEGGKNNFDNKNATQVITKAVEQVHGKVKIIGEIDKYVFPRLQAQCGELTWDFCSKVSRMASASMGTDHLGNILLIGEHTSPVTQELVEGENILKMQCVFSNEQMYSEYALTGQWSVTDDKTMKQAADARAIAHGMMTEVYRRIDIPSEQNDTNNQRRATYEALQADGTQLVANVTVQGWLRDGVNLWRCGDIVVIKSPMCPMDLGMKIQTATFTQDSRGGTTTLLECVLPWKLGDRQYTGGNVPAGTSPAPQPPAPAKEQNSLPPVQGLE